MDTYCDYLEKLNRERDRIIAFVLYIFFPKVQKYIRRIDFFLDSKKNITTELSVIEVLRGKYRDIIPNSDFFQKTTAGGVQKLLNEGAL